MSKKFNEKPENGLPFSKDDFVSYKPDHKYILVPTGAIWTLGGLDCCFESVPWLNADGSPKIIRFGPYQGAVKMQKPHEYVDSMHPVHAMTWAPGEEQLIRDRLINTASGWKPKVGAITYNRYQPPPLVVGNMLKSRFWLKHLKLIYPLDWKHLLSYWAFKVQHPEVKINHMILLGGTPGIGKNSLFEPVYRALGPWNCKEASPNDVLGQWSAFKECIFLRVSEAGDVVDSNRFKLYETMKTLCVIPPEVIPVNDKYIPIHPIVNCCGIIVTTNHRLDGFFIPHNDRRVYAAWSESKKEDFTPEYWNKFYDQLDHGGAEGVLAYLMAFDLSEFNAKTPPPQTDWWHALVGVNAPQEDGELMTAIEKAGNPDAITISMVEQHAETDFSMWLSDRKNRCRLPHRFDSCGYSQVVNTTSKQGLWQIAGKQQVVYARKELTTAERIAAAKKLESGIPTEVAAGVHAAKAREARAKREYEITIMQREALEKKMATQYEPGTDKIIPMKPVNPHGPVMPPERSNPFHPPARPPFQPGEPKMSAMEDLVAKPKKDDSGSREPK